MISEKTEDKKLMDTEKNISVTLKQPDENNKEIAISFSTIFKQAKRFFMLWIVAAAVTAMFIAGIVMMLKTNISDGNVTALISFNYSGIESGLDPNGNTLDVNKIKSPNIIESALTELNMPLKYVENIRRNISIKGIMPDEVVDEISMYNSIYSSGGSAALSAVESMLDIGYYPSYYIITFDYSSSGLDLTESKQVLDGILNNYQEYFFVTYGYNKTLGNSVVAVDYSEYDYPTAIDVFDDTLSTLDEYVSNLSAVSPDFRSGKTGYSFEDLKITIETVKTVDLYSLSSYVSINNITNDKKYLLTYYEYEIEQLQRQKNVYQSELDSIINSIENYEKDNMVIFGSGTEEDGQTYSQMSEKYDELFEQKISKQKQLSKCKQRIEYYKDRTEALNKNSGSLNDETREETETRLSKLNVRINDLIDIVNETSDEYYETVTFAKAYNILVPATGAEPAIVTKDIMMPVILGEVLIFVIYIGAAFVTAVVKDCRAAKERDSEKSEKEK